MMLIILRLLMVVIILEMVHTLDTSKYCLTSKQCLVV